MYFNSDKDIDKIGEGLLELSLPKPEWTHAAHFAAAVWLLVHPKYNAAKDMPDIIRRYNEATGVPNTDTDGYHETITQASLLAARSYLETAGLDLPVYETVNQLLNSELGRSDWLLNYWSKEVLFAVKARRTWVDPDIQSLPF